MKAWLLSVTATVLLFVLLEILLPDGSIKKYVQGILRLIVVVVLLLPIVNLATDKDFYNELFVDHDSNSTANETYPTTNMDIVNNVVLTQTEKKIQEKIKSEGYDCDVQIQLSDNRICNITILLKNYGIKTEEDNIYTTAMIKRTVQEILSFDEEKIIINVMA